MTYTTKFKRAASDGDLGFSDTRVVLVAENTRAHSRLMPKLVTAGLAADLIQIEAPGTADSFRLNSHVHDFCIVDCSVGEVPTDLIQGLLKRGNGVPVVGLVGPSDNSGHDTGHDTGGEAIISCGAIAYLTEDELATTTGRRIIRLALSVASMEARRLNEIEEIQRHLVDAHDSRERFELQNSETIALAEDLERAYRLADTASREAAETAQRMESVINTVVDSVLIARRDGTIERANPAAEAMFGHSAKNLSGMPLSALLPNITLSGSDGSGEPKTAFEWGAISATGEPFPVELSVGTMVAGEAVLDICVARDITDRRRAEAKIRDLALTDPLTGLANRNLFHRRLDDAIEYAVRLDKSVALILMDLNKFKAINDNFGHPTGDALLVEVAEQLRQVTRKHDTVARLGGDEFAVILTNLNSTTEVHVLLNRIVEAVCTPLVIDGSLIEVGTAMGVSFFPQDDIDVANLVKKADMALYQAKTSGENTYRIFDKKLHQRTRQRKQIEDDLRLAIVRDEFELYVQPQIDASEHRVIGAEALIRWQHPARGLMSPDEFIPIAESTGLIAPMGAWVLRETCRNAVEWLDHGLPPIRAAVNISLRQFQDKALIDTINNCLSETGIDPSRLELELTETAVENNLEQLIEKLETLRDLGVFIAIDDFGTGYSSLAYLKRFPVQRLKVDRVFVADIDKSPSGAAIAKAIVDLALGLDLSIVAEGIETEAEAEFFLNAGCPDMQGYHFARPMPATKFVNWFKAYEARQDQSSARKAASL